MSCFWCFFVGFSGCSKGFLRVFYFFLPLPLGLPAFLMMFQYFVFAEVMGVFFFWGGRGILGQVPVGFSTSPTMGWAKAQRTLMWRSLAEEMLLADNYGGWWDRKGTEQIVKRPRKTFRVPGMWWKKSTLHPRWFLVVTNIRVLKLFFEGNFRPKLMPPTCREPGVANEEGAIRCVFLDSIDVVVRFCMLLHFFFLAGGSNKDQVFKGGFPGFLKGSVPRLKKLRIVWVTFGVPKWAPTKPDW